MDLVRLRYVGAERVRVPKLGKVVEPDELVGVPVDVYERYAWPESQWKRQDAEQPPPGEQQTPAAGRTTTNRRSNGDA
ncbi:hypothetical protein [Micromonospora fulviviridis]|uniref:hypothetical protein n=1 Tax=Micromonospora fulviviridis TaxID=47860 RepID=UPI0037AC25C0